MDPPRRHPTRLQSLVPHLKTAFALHRRLHKAEVLAHASLVVQESLPMGVLMLGEGDCILSAKARAHSFTRSTGLGSISGSEGLRA